MKRILLWLILAALVVAGVLVYRSQSRTHINVTPGAQREIDKAMQR